MQLNEQNKIVPLIAPADHASGLTPSGFSMENAHHATIVVLWGAKDGSEAQIELEAGTAHDTYDDHVPFVAKRTNADFVAANGDVLSHDHDLETGEDYFYSAAASRMTVIEISASSLPAGKTWVRVKIGSQATDQFAAAVAIIQPRYAPLTTAVQTT